MAPAKRNLPLAIRTRQFAAEAQTEPAHNHELSPSARMLGEAIYRVPGADWEVELAGAFGVGAGQWVSVTYPGPRTKRLGMRRQAKAGRREQRRDFGRALSLILSVRFSFTLLCRLITSSRLELLSPSPRTSRVLPSHTAYAYTAPSQSRPRRLTSTQPRLHPTPPSLA